MTLRIAIDARVRPGVHGGVVQGLAGLALGLSALDDGDEEYFFLTDYEAPDWIAPYLVGQSRILVARRPPRQRLKRRLQRIAERRLPSLLRAWRALPAPHPRGPRALPRSDGALEEAAVDLVHFAHQQAFETSIPSLYQPHDLQHVHFPAFFTRRDRDQRESMYRAASAEAELVIALTTWSRADFIRHLELPAEKVVVVPPAPAVTTIPGRPDPDAVRRRFELPPAFAFYPANTWEHKNHLRLLEAVAVLRDEHGLDVPLVCCGTLTPHFGRIQERMSELRLSRQVHFLGYIDDQEVAGLYGACRLVVFPSLFEGWGYPVCDAFAARAPVACAAVTSLPALVGEDALTFDPLDTHAIANSVALLWTDESLRAELAERGHRDVKRFSWERTARLMRAHYRRVAGTPLSAEDRRLLAAAPLV